VPADPLKNQQHHPKARRDMFSSPGFLLGFSVGIAVLLAGVASTLLALWMLRLIDGLCSRHELGCVSRRGTAVVRRDGSTVPLEDRRGQLVLGFHQREKVAGESSINVDWVRIDRNE
jgi:hypothetical protein